MALCVQWRRAVNLTPSPRSVTASRNMACARKRLRRFMAGRMHVGWPFPSRRGPVIDRIQRDPFMSLGGRFRQLRASAMRCAWSRAGCRCRTRGEGGGCGGFEVGEPRRAPGVQGPRRRAAITQSEQTRSCFRDWLDSGDYATSSMGNLSDRRVKDLIIRGGRNIFPYISSRRSAHSGVRKGAWQCSERRPAQHERLCAAETRETEARARAVAAQDQRNAVDVLGMP